MTTCSISRVKKQKRSCFKLSRKRECFLWECENNNRKHSRNLRRKQRLSSSTKESKNEQQKSGTESWAISTSMICTECRTWSTEWRFSTERSSSNRVRHVWQENSRPLQAKNQWEERIRSYERFTQTRGSRQEINLLREEQKDFRAILTICQDTQNWSSLNPEIKFWDSQMNFWRRKQSRTMASAQLSKCNLTAKKSLKNIMNSLSSKWWSLVMKRSSKDALLMLTDRMT